MAITFIKQIINKKIVKRVLNVYLTILLCSTVASILTGCTIVTGSENVTLTIEQTGSVMGM